MFSKALEHAIKTAALRLGECGKYRDSRQRKQQKHHGQPQKNQYHPSAVWKNVEMRSVRLVSGEVI